MSQKDLLWVIIILLVVFLVGWMLWPKAPSTIVVTTPAPTATETATPTTTTTPTSTVSPTGPTVTVPKIY